MAENKKWGVKKVPTEDRHIVRLHVRPDDYEVLERFAEADDLLPGQWARERILEALRRREQEERVKGGSDAMSRLVALFEASRGSEGGGVGELEF